MYVVVPGFPSAFYFSANGRDFAARRPPCPAAEQSALVQVVPTSATALGLLCVGQPQIGMAVKTVYRSMNTGKTDTSAGTTSAPGINAELAASPSGNLLVGAWAAGSVIYLNDTHGTKWSTALVPGNHLRMLVTGVAVRVWRGAPAGRRGRWRG